MQNARGLTSAREVLGVAAILASLLLALPFGLHAQNTCSGSQGNNGVYNATCNNSSPGVVGSSAFIDASMFGNQNTNICKVLHDILVSASYPSVGTVIDARGLPGNTGTSMTCAASPWAGITNPPPSTILLPARTIAIPGAWVLPNQTTLIGESDGITPGTIIQAKLSFPDPAMMNLGGPTVCPLVNGVAICNSVVVENLTLDGQSQAINGIVNTNAQTGTQVDHVTLYQIRGTGLSVSGAANDSGPYSNITFDLGGASGTSSTHCASINGLISTRGIHGLTCIAENNDPPAAVLLDSSNNSIEDVRIVGFYDGILVGANADAKSNVLINIIGDTTIPGGLTPVNTVHISSNHSVSDLSVVGLSNIGGTSTYSLEDDLTGPHLSDTSIGIYALGEPASGGYSRFSTSPNVANWAAGSSSPTAGCSTASRGSMYSCTGSGTACGNPAKALWVCLPGGWTGVQ